MICDAALLHITFGFACEAHKPPATFCAHFSYVSRVFKLFVSASQQLIDITTASEQIWSTKDQQHVDDAMDTPPAQRPFPFFDLPRELRDHIYSYLHHNHKDVLGRAGCENEPKISLRSCPLASASLVCSQFVHEYRDAKEKQTTMLFYDHMEFQPDTPKSLGLTLRKVRPLMQGALRNVRFAEFNITGSFFYVAGWLRGKGPLHLETYYSQKLWIDAVTQAFTSLESFQIRYSLTGWRKTKLLPRWSDRVLYMTTLEEITDLLTIPKLSELELFAASGIPQCSVFDVVDHELNEKSSIATWTPGELWRCKGEESAFEVTSGSCGKYYCYACT